MADGGAPFTVRVGCEDCIGTDSYGCFDGSTIILEERQAPYATRSFDTVAAAREAGEEYVGDCSPWYFEILNRDGLVVGG